MKFNNHMTRSVAFLAVIESIQAARLQALTGIDSILLLICLTCNVKTI